MFRKLLIAIAFLLFSACSNPNRVKKVVVVDVPAQRVPGTVTQAWEAPIYDTVRVPAQLDPRGTYYRASHRTVVEIRPGRVQEVQYPSSKSEAK